MFIYLLALPLFCGCGCGVLGCPVQVVAGPWTCLACAGVCRGGDTRGSGGDSLFSYAPLSVFGLTRCSLPMVVSVGVGRVHEDRRGAMSENSILARYIEHTDTGILYISYTYLIHISKRYAMKYGPSNWRVRADKI
eukprot:3316594-Pyramimonas_sp.AAC.1